MNLEQAKEIPIKDYLDFIGIQPEMKIRGGTEYRYFAFYRTERTPSLDINIVKNNWIDRGEGIGGDIVDLVSKVNSCNISEALKILSQHFGSGYVTPYEQNHESRTCRKSNNEIVSIASIWKSDLIDYSLQRGISTKVLKEETKEITYKNTHGVFKAIGFKNELNGWNLRSEKGEFGFKGIIGVNDISIRYPGKNSIVVVEGFFDYLSILELSEKPYKYSYLILNGVGNLKKAYKILGDYEIIWLALDNDEAGKKTTLEILKNFINAKNLSEKYKGFKDLNDYLIKK